MRRDFFGVLLLFALAPVLCGCGFGAEQSTRADDQTKSLVEDDTNNGKNEAQDLLLADADQFVTTSFDRYQGQRKFTSLVEQRKLAWKAAAEQGDSTGLFLWATCHYTGIGADRDLAKATELLRQAAQKGSLHAYVMLGTIAESANLKTAITFYKKAADENFAWGEYRLGVTHSEGRLVPRDEQQAFKIILSAAEHGLAAAQTDIGRRLEDAGNDTKAFTWYGKAAAQDDAVGHLNVGVCHLLGKGTPVDRAMAKHHLKRAAELGEPLASQYLRALDTR
jgi:TPR repeat protein